MTSSIRTRAAIPEPDWLVGLVIYEVATRAFTSPNGPGSGTFRSCAEKIPYLRDLGVTGLWLTGHNWADDTHFYNIWTQYATIRPDVLDPCLGTEEDFHHLVNTAHAAGVRVFLDVTTHGVMSSSPLVGEHPNWFSGGSWGMTDYDWQGEHEDLERWWVETWVNYVTRYGVDGYRLDVSMYRPDLWQEIKRRAWEAGHPIVVFHELGPGRRGVVDFLQWGLRLKFNTETLDPRKPLISDMPSTIARELRNELPEVELVVETKDGRTLSTATSGEGRLSIERRSTESRDVANRRTGDTFGEDLAVLEVSGLPAHIGIENVSVKDGPFYVWRHHGNVGADFTLSYRRTDQGLVVRFPRRTAPGERLSVQLSCHDDGWEGYPKGANPYVAQGSRFVFGYAALLLPAVPNFMSGEEFDAQFVPLPGLSPHLFGGQDPGEGTWLYGSWIRWEQLEQPRHHDMLLDARRIIGMRRRYAHLIVPLRREDVAPGFWALPSSRPSGLPVPYAYCDMSTLLLIAGNPSRGSDVVLPIEVPWDSLPIRKTRTYQVSDIWNETPSRRVDRSALTALEVPIARDGQARGGLAVWEIVCLDQ